jgi:FkbM family methyltransferase
MSLSELKQRFAEGELLKAEYIEKMFEQHKSLAEYADLIAGTEIVEIAIGEGQLRFKTRTDGLTLVCDRVDKRTAPFEILNFGSYEKGEAEVMLSLIKPGDTVFDIGANIGWYSLTIAKHFPTALIYAFEPMTPTFALMQRNLDANRVTSVTAFNLGFSDRAETLTFFYDPDHSSKTSAADLTGGAHRVQAHVQRLDDLVAEKNVRKVDFIKCDVEGAEILVYRGGIETLKRDHPIVFSEMLRKWSAKFGYHPNDIIALFADLGYQCSAVSGNRLTPISSVTEETTETNFAFLHTVDHQAQIKAISLR